MALGDCRNNSEDIFACDYTKDDGLYFFDWAKLQWINHQGKVLSFQIIKTKLFRTGDWNFEEVFFPLLNVDSIILYFPLLVTTLSHGNKGSRAFHVPEIDVFGSPIISEIQCTNIKWPKCIEYGVDYVPVSHIGT